MPRHKSNIQVSILILLFVFMQLSKNIIAQSKVIQGIVTEKNSNSNLAFVNISIEGKTGGTTTDIDGKFKIICPENSCTLLFTYVGYEPLHIEVVDTTTRLFIQLKRKTYQLAEVEVKAKENPAHRIIRTAIANRDKNDPEKLGSFSYTSYNKLYFTRYENDSAKTQLQNDTSRIDSTKIRENKFFETQHLFLMESVSNRKFLYPDMNNEKVIASRISGFQQPAFTLLATELQSFSFYTDLISVFGRKYVNPISKGSIERYFFLIEDTAYSGIDTTYIISFRPRKGKYFDGLTGVVYINTHGYAIQNVIAEPTKDNEGGFTVKIQQKYELIGNKRWFPTQLNSDIIMGGGIQVNGSGLIGVGRSYLSDILIDPPLPKKEFNHLEMEVLKDAGNKDELFWNKYRSDSLSQKDIKTYHVIDSVGKELKLDQKFKALNALLSGKFPYKKIDIDLNRIMTFNDYEGFRLGFGAHTNYLFSELFSIGGYAAWGFSDRSFKYGSDLTINLNRRYDVFINGAYSQDVIESGSTTFYNDRRAFTSSENYRDYLVSRMDSIQKYEFSLGFRMHPVRNITARTTLFFNRQNRISTNDYKYGNYANNIAYLYDNFYFTELGASMKITYKEKFAKISFEELSMGTDYPTLWVQYTQGLKDVWDGGFMYKKLDLKLEKFIRWKIIGRSYVRILAGITDGNIPYTILYNGLGSNKYFGNNKDFRLGIFTSNSFQTMGMNEFLSDRYISFFFIHNFRKLLFRTENFKPDISIAHHMGWGALSNTQSHFYIPFKTMEQGFYESGILLSNLYKTGFTGLGISAFYRYGPNSLPKTEDNFAFKLTLSVRL